MAKKIYGVDTYPYFEKQALEMCRSCKNARKGFWGRLNFPPNAVCVAPENDWGREGGEPPTSHRRCYEANKQGQCKHYAPK
ncbi:MAG: hypothetical protein PHE27_05805 [Alphaproteobacteria bacterium]|nr:hypothetical protein [Alphaproteobacteria bacterium]